MTSGHNRDKEIARRRTFAIISHPDAGKTTLTEKFLLYGGAINLAGAVKSRKTQKTATSDWMEIEKQRGISISSTVLQFEYSGYCVNILDTPGHRDFSEDTYRVLTAVDSVVMVIDAAKGIEPQTRKLFEICKLRKIPIFTFINKMDRPGKPPLDLIDEIEKVLGVSTLPMNWPLGTGPEFKGVISLADKMAHVFERNPGGARRAEEVIVPLDEMANNPDVPAHVLNEALDELSLLEGAGAEFDLNAIHTGALSPLFFGSAMNNFGVQSLLDSFLKLGLPPQPKPSKNGLIAPEQPGFSGFIFKIQANMDPNHRDRIAFVRICSGQFQREMDVILVRTGKRIRLSSAHKLFGRDRETLEEAWPGDIVGILGHSDFRIGDTLTEKSGVEFAPMPTFAPEIFAYLHSDTTAQFKRFRDGLDQLLQEGVVQVIQMPGATARVPMLGAVGQLQLEVVQYRLKSEYGADSRLERTSWQIMRWIHPSTDPAVIEAINWPTSCQVAIDQMGRKVILFDGQWGMQYFMDKNPKVILSDNTLF